MNCETVRLKEMLSSFWAFFVVHLLQKNRKVAASVMKQRFLHKITNQKI
jgi:hypothetical protein